MPHCVMCGSYIPEDQGSSTCSMCYGDPYHGKDGYYLRYLEEQEEEALEKRAREEYEWEMLMEEEQ